MPARIRLPRAGRKQQPSYRVVVAQSSAARRGAYLDNVGFHNPRRDPLELKLHPERLDQAVAKGAEMTPTVASLVRKVRNGEIAQTETAAEAKPAAKAAPKAEAKPEPLAEEAAPVPAAEEPTAEPAAEAEEPAAEE